MKKYLSIVLALSAALSAFPQDASSDYVLVWSDEFSQDGPVDSEKWHHQTILPNGYPNGFSWYNGEEQHYTNRIENSSVQNGFLKITAIKEQFSDQGHTKSYTSARLNSKFAFTYGRVDVRAKLPSGKGTWPAIWMLGQNITEPGGYWAPTHGTTPWPACGEIDIMEHWGVDLQNMISAALHTPSSHGGTINKGTIEKPDVGNNFYEYSMIWDENKIEFLVDGTSYYTYQPAFKNAENWPFDKPQYLLLNIAMGGVFSIDPNFVSSSMEIDYVRVYQKEGASEVPAPQVTAEIPTTVPEQVLAVFSDSYESNTTIDSWLGQGSVGSVEDVQIEGRNIKYYQNADVIHIEAIENQLDIQQMTHLHFDIWSENTALVNIRLVDAGPNGIYQNGTNDDSESGLFFGGVAQSDWIGYDVLLSNFNQLQSRANIARITFDVEPAGTSNFYLDNLFFYRDSPPLSIAGEEDKLVMKVENQLLEILFPRPTNIESFAIYDLTGRIVMRNNTGLKNISQLSVPVGTANLHIVKLVTDQGVTTQKVYRKD